MSQLSDILNTAQITKYYELLQFISSHANVEYTLAQLDYLIPRGASLQRFPEAWVEYMKMGLCSNQSIEVYYRSADCLALASSGESSGGERTKEHLVLICRRPEIHRLKELSALLQSCSTLPDTEGCIALHTDQVILHERLLKESQRQGLLYYFPDNYAKIRDHRGAKVKRGVSSSGEAMNVFLRDEEAESLLGGEGPTGRLELPVGVTAQFMLYTRRGVPVRGKNDFPIRLNTGERVMVIFDKTAVSGQDTSPSERPPVVRVSLGQPSGSSGGVLPLEVRVKASAGSGGNRRSFMDIRAHTRGKVTLSLFVDDRETILPVEVLDEIGAMPGVMIGRETYPTVPLPDAIRISDPALWSSAVGEEETNGVRQEGNASNIIVNSDSGGGNGSNNGRQARRALSWWLNPSPSILQVRDITLPDSETMTAASQAIWIPHQADETAMKAVRNALRDQHAAEATRRSRRKRNRNRDLRNCHMVHFGFDASVAFGGEPQDR
ncbi:hypothetical protein DQ04_01861130 [Trypanosoma grayi]|uniref:hypothetical protein n=1 Tax=Trypanosoma grayi TaxID=71804 RepID=UPI0004F464D3|nr:hypothetical protein DQ04_01861130 [Trypanosoma grayi]KEG12254.1 hypothetical protein DQ04_01861130 [Trypanosoma grayi]